MLEKNEIYTIILTCYNQNDYIKEAIDSIIIQNYQNIEIIIIDDYSSYFDVFELEKYIKTNKKENIKDYKIIRNEKNLGTVLSLKKAISISTGKYISFFAADDALYDENVISENVRIFNRTNEKIIASKTIMLDTDLREKISDFPTDNIDYINNLKSIDQYKVIAIEAIFASGAVAYRKEIFNKYSFNSKYKLIEDWPFHLMLTRKGEKIYYFDKYSLKHRSGGISNNDHKNKNILKIVNDDIMNVYKLEIFPYINLFSNETKLKIMNTYKYHLINIKKYNYIKYLLKAIIQKIKY